MLEVPCEVVNESDASLVATRVTNERGRSAQARAGDAVGLLGRQAATEGRFHLLLNVKSQLVLNVAVGAPAKDETAEPGAHGEPAQHRNSAYGGVRTNEIAWDSRAHAFSSRPRYFEPAFVIA